MLSARNLLLCLCITAAPSRPSQADVLYVKLSDGSTQRFESGQKPTAEDVNFIVDWAASADKAVNFGKIDFEPVACPWDVYFLPCTPYSLSDYDGCMFAEMKNVSGNLTNVQFSVIQTMASKICYRRAGGTSEY